MLEVYLTNIGFTFDGFTKNKIIPFESILPTFLALLFVLILPNTQQIMAKFRPAIETYHNEITTNGVKYLQWKPNKIWAIGTGLVAAISILCLNRVSEFLYFQF
jgi:hypothetical protein